MNNKQKKSMESINQNRTESDFNVGNFVRFFIIFYFCALYE